MLRLSALFLGLLGLVGLYFHSTLPVTGHIRPGFFVFYTNLSNLLLAVYQLTLGVSGHDPQCGVFRWLSSAGVALSMTLCIFVTHLIYQWVLVPSAKKSGKALSDIGFSSFGNLCVHYAVPWLTVVQSPSSAPPGDWCCRSPTLPSAWPMGPRESPSATRSAATPTRSWTRR